MTKRGMNKRAVVPRAGADKDAANKPTRTVEANWSASVGRIRVVAIGANRSWPDVSRSRNNWGPKTHAHNHSLCVSVGSSDQTNAKHGENF